MPLQVRFRGVEERQGLLFHGPAGWGECAPFVEYGPREASAWMESALAQARTAPPQPVRSRIPVNVTVPVLTPEQAASRVRAAGCATAKVKVADPRVTPSGDADRVRATAETLADLFGSAGKVRVDANGAWNRTEALQRIAELDEAAAPVGGLEYVEQPCAAVEDLAWVRGRTPVKIAADESIRRADDPFRVVEEGAADIAVVKVPPLGGARAALRLADMLPLPVVVSSALDTSIGLAGGVLLAGAVPHLEYACGLDTARLLAADVTPHSLVSQAGHLSIAAAEDIIAGPLREDAAVLPESTQAWWVARAEQMIAEVEKGA